MKRLRRRNKQYNIISKFLDEREREREEREREKERERETTKEEQQKEIEEIATHSYKGRQINILI